MLDHTGLNVSDFTRSKAFYLKALAPLGIVVLGEGKPSYGIEMSADNKSSLVLFETQEKPAHLHIAFVAETREQVLAFHKAALEAGGKDNGPPGLRPNYHANYYAAFVIDPDGHNIELVCHAPG